MTRDKPNMDRPKTDQFERALEHALAAGRNRAVARCLPAAAKGLLKVAAFHGAVSARFLAEWLEERR